MKNPPFVSCDLRFVNMREACQALGCAASGHPVKGFSELWVNSRGPAHCEARFVCNGLPRLREVHSQIVQRHGPTARRARDIDHARMRAHVGERAVRAIVSARVLDPHVRGVGLVPWRQIARQQMPERLCPRGSEEALGDIVEAVTGRAHARSNAGPCQGPAAVLARVRATAVSVVDEAGCIEARCRASVLDPFLADSSFEEGRVRLWAGLRGGWFRRARGRSRGR